MIGGDGVRDVLHQHRLAGARRRHDQRALAFADRSDDVDHPCRKVFSRRVLELEAEALVRKQRRQIVEIDLVLGLFRIFEIEGVDLEQREIAFAFLRAADVAFDGVAGTMASAGWWGKTAWAPNRSASACWCGNRATARMRLFGCSSRTMAIVEQPEGAAAPHQHRGAFGGRPLPAPRAATPRTGPPAPLPRRAPRRGWGCTSTRAPERRARSRPSRRCCCRCGCRPGCTPCAKLRQMEYWPTWHSGHGGVMPRGPHDQPGIEHHPITQASATARLDRRARRSRPPRAPAPAGTR